MHAKHYVAVAAVLAAEYQVATEDQREGLDRVIHGLAGVFQQDNPRFDRARFMDAVFAGD